MGAQDISNQPSASSRRAFLRSVIEDLDVLEEMLAREMFETGTPRIGAEQELLLVDEKLDPAPIGPELLEHVKDPRVSPELGRFNLELNLTPRAFEGRCLTALHLELESLAARVRACARARGADLLLSGIAPNFEQVHGGLDQLTPRPRYAALNHETMARLNHRMPLRIDGLESFSTWHDSIGVEMAATSFQVHLQVTPDAFAQVFNCALLSTGPLLALSGCAPFFAGRRLWHETRVPLLESCADIRTPAQMRRGGRTRTCLGSDWVQGSVLELFRRELARYESALQPGHLESSRERLDAGEVPALSALATFSGSIWPWVRACYGVTEGRPHLRIENRVLPSGPTFVDEVANAAFWLGLMVSLPVEYGDIRERIPFEDAEMNHHAGARDGLRARLRWLDGRRVTARTLILDELLPLARAGLLAADVDEDDTRRYCEIIEERVASGQTGAEWMLRRFDALHPLPRRERTWRITGEMLRHQQQEMPVHHWPTAQLPAGVHDPRLVGERASVGRVLRTEIFSVRPEDPLELALRILKWEKVSHLVVESDSGQFLGLVSADMAPRQRHISRSRQAESLVEDVYLRTAPRLHPRQSAEDALTQLRTAGSGCGVILEGDCAAALVYEKDLLLLVGEERTLQAPSG